MGTQFIVSLLGGSIAAGALLFIGGTYVYKWYKKDPINITGEVVAVVSIFLVMGGVSAYKLAEASYHYAVVGKDAVVESVKDGTNAVLDAGQDVISGTVKYFSVAVLEGVGQTYEHFEAKWDKEQIESFKDLELRVVSVKKEMQHGKDLLHLMLEVSNVSKKSIDFNELVTHQLLLLKSKNEAYAPLTLNGRAKSMDIPAGTTIMLQVDILVGQKEQYPTMLSTPTQQLELK